MKPQEMEEKAAALFGNLFHCSQAVLAVGQEKLGKETDEDMMRAMDVFGGGLGAHGEACGALIGALAVVGLMFGRSEGGRYPDARMWKYAHELTKRFRSEVTGGKILCRDIAGVDWTKADQVKAFREGTKRRDCGILTGKTAGLLGEIIDRAMEEKRKT